MSTDQLTRLKRRLSETDDMIAKLSKKAESDPEWGYSIAPLEDTRCAIITQIYEVEHPGMTLDEMGQTIPKPAPIPLRPNPERQPSPEDQEAEEWMSKTLTLLCDAKDKFRPGESGVMACPICRKSVSVSRAKSNGHVWAKCETADCIRFME